MKFKCPVDNTEFEELLEKEQFVIRNK